MVSDIGLGGGLCMLCETDVILGDARQTMSCGQRCDISHVVIYSLVRHIDSLT